jgi:hypothetical protein
LLHGKRQPHVKRARRRALLRGVSAHAAALYKTRPRPKRCLEELSITSAYRLKDAHLAPLAARAPTLCALSLRGCSGVGAKGSRPSDAVAALCALTRLRRLDLSHTGFSGGGSQQAPQSGRLQLRELAAALPGLTSLGLAGLQLDAAACAGLERLYGLRDLDLSDSDLTPGFIEGALGGLTQLTALRLAWCGGRALPLFGSLRLLDISQSLLEGVAHSTHGEAMRLERLWCGGCDARELAALALPAVIRCARVQLKGWVLAPGHIKVAIACAAALLL